MAGWWGTRWVYSLSKVRSWIKGMRAPRKRGFPRSSSWRRYGTQHSAWVRGWRMQLWIWRQTCNRRLDQIPVIRSLSRGNNLRWVWYIPVTGSWLRAGSTKKRYCAISINSAGHVTRYMPAEILNSAHGGNDRYIPFFRQIFRIFL